MKKRQRGDHLNGKVAEVLIMHKETQKLVTHETKCQAQEMNAVEMQNHIGKTFAHAMKSAVLSTQDGLLSIMYEAVQYFV